jgi:hypothetical protein
VAWAVMANVARKARYDQHLAEAKSVVFMPGFQV